MASVNKVILLGRLGRDPEARQTGGGTSVTNLNLATDESFKNRSGEREQRTEWHRVACFGNLADHCARYLEKGRQVYVEGRLQTREWQDKEGAKRFTTEVVAQSVQFLDSRGQQQGGPYDGPPPKTGRHDSGPQNDGPVFEDDDVPFHPGDR